MSHQIETLYYDGQCPLCSKEMSRLEAQKPTNLKLTDIHQTEMDGATKQRMLKVLHLEVADGTFRTGLEANIAAWEQTRLAMFWRWLRLPVIRSFAGVLYNAWAANRYARLYHQRTSHFPFE